MPQPNASRLETGDFFYDRYPEYHQQEREEKTQMGNGTAGGNRATRKLIVRRGGGYRPFYIADDFYWVDNGIPLPGPYRVLGDPPPAIVENARARRGAEESGRAKSGAKSADSDDNATAKDARIAMDRDDLSVSSSSGGKADIGENQDIWQRCRRAH